MWIFMIWRDVKMKNMEHKKEVFTYLSYSNFIYQESPYSRIVLWWLFQSTFLQFHTLT